MRLVRLAIVLALSLFVLVQCTVRIEMFYENGQVCVVGGGKDSRGDREGAWLYFNPDGSVQTTFGNPPVPATGFYEKGKRIRDLTADELATLTLEGQRLTAEQRQR